MDENLVFAHVYCMQFLPLVPVLLSVDIDVPNRYPIVFISSFCHLGLDISNGK